MSVQNTKAVVITESLDFAPYCSMAATQQGHPAVYQLTAVCHHHGRSATEGHYIAHCRSGVNSNWYCCDDDRVTCKEGMIVDAPSTSAYLLIYRRQDD